MKKSLYQIAFLPFVFICVTAFAVLSLKPVDSADSVTFVIKNLGINTKGELSGLKGTVEWNEDNPAESKFAVTVAVSTINTGIDKRDEHLKKEEYFDAEHYPEIKIVSNTVTKSSNGDILAATLTIKGVSKNITIPFTATKSGDSYIFSGKFSINRRDYGVGGNSVVLSDNIDVTLNITTK